MEKPQPPSPESQQNWILPPNERVKVDEVTAAVIIAIMVDNATPPNGVGIVIDRYSSNEFLLTDPQHAESINRKINEILRILRSN